MNSEITLIVRGNSVSESQIQGFLETIPGVKATKVGEDRSVISGAKIFKYIMDFAGGSSHIVDALTEQAGKELAGANFKLKLGDMEVEVSNVNRSQVAAIFERAAEIAKARDSL